jgi:hypothetical protein
MAKKSKKIAKKVKKVAKKPTKGKMPKGMY